MAQCIWCGRSGLFLPVNKEGVCNVCQPFVHMDIENNIRILNDSLKLVRDTKNVDTLIMRLDLIIQCSDDLMKYEKKGINTTDPSPSRFNQEFRNKRDAIILERLEDDYNNAVKSIALPGVTSKKKINSLNKILLKNLDVRNKIATPSKLDELDQKIKTDINKIQFESLLDDARKAEFKNNKKIALNKYYEALYFLQHDEIDDSLQFDNISQIQKKIVEIGGELKS